jgi:hypothetical protein
MKVRFLYWREDLSQLNTGLLLANSCISVNQSSRTEQGSFPPFESIGLQRLSYFGWQTLRKAFIKLFGTKDVLPPVYRCTYPEVRVRFPALPDFQRNLFPTG